jgi:predicted lipoprotein with Yx(FWY)xxD motif
MRTRIAVFAAAAVAVFALAGCSSGGSGAGMYGSSTSGSPSGSGSSAAAGSTSAAALATGNTSLGTVVVDGRGLTVYVFDKDTQNSGASSCSGACAAQWPAVETTVAKPAVTGVTGTVGTITGVDGKKQVTLDGRPLYTYAGDSSAGDVTGQGVGGIWWAVSPDGMKIAAATSGGGAGSGYSK